jgi:phenylacetic acid degradation operon negative regulatory protein
MFRRMEPTAKSLILDLLSTLRGRAMPVRALVAAGGVFGLPEEGMRVTLARLASRGLVERTGRGLYALAKKADPVQSHVASWAQVEQRVVAWKGGWIAAHTAGFARSDRSALRQRRRAFGFLGFAELSPELWIRPDNLRGGVVDVRVRLHRFGLEPSAPVFRLDGLDGSTELHARTLWDTDGLRLRYRDLQRELAGSAARLGELSPERAMVESFTLGGRAIRCIVLDPLLPEPLVPAAERRAVLDAMRAYDRIGRERWREFMKKHGAPHLETPLEYGRRIDAA